MNKDDVAGLVERLLVPDVYGYQGRKQAEEANTLRQEAADALTTLSAERDDLRRRLDNICMDIHTCNGDDCERPICLERRKNAILSARVETLEAALRDVFIHGHGEGWRGNQMRRDVKRVDAEKSWSLYVSSGALGKTIAHKALEGSGNG